MYGQGPNNYICWRPRSILISGLSAFLALELAEYDPKGCVCTQVIKDRRNKSKYTSIVLLEPGDGSAGPHLPSDAGVGELLFQGQMCRVDCSISVFGQNVFDIIYASFPLSYYGSTT